MPAPTTPHDLLERARSLVPERGRAVLGICGMPGSGKSTLAAYLLSELTEAPPPGSASGHWVQRVPMDGFHLAEVELERLGLAAAKGAPETFDAAGYVALVHRLLEETDDVVYAPAFDRRLEEPVAASIPVLPQTRLVITEGNYLLLDQGPWRALPGLLAQTWYCDADPRRRVDQLIARHAEFGKSPERAHEWATGPDQANADLVARTSARADLLVPESVLAALPVTVGA